MIVALFPKICFTWVDFCIRSDSLYYKVFLEFLISKCNFAGILAKVLIEAGFQHIFVKEVIFHTFQNISTLISDGG